MGIRSSLHSVRIGQLLRCAHKRVVNIMKVYIERNNIQVDLIRSRKQKSIYSRLCLRGEEVREPLFVYSIYSLDGSNWPRTRQKAAPLAL